MQISFRGVKKNNVWFVSKENLQPQLNGWFGNRLHLVLFSHRRATDCVFQLQINDFKTWFEKHFSTV